jgi:iron complex outermembrane receptor protein
MVLSILCLLIPICGAAEAGSADVEPEPAQSPDLTELDLEDLMDIEVDVVYSASRFDQKTLEAPSAVSIITAEDIRRFGYRNLAEILRTVRGLYSTYDRNYHYLGVRGFSRPGDYNTRVLLLVDGHRVNSDIYDQATMGTDFLVDVDLIERVEVIRGPGSSLYGTNALFAVINVITRRGRDLDGLESAVETASFDSHKGRLTWGGRLESGLELLISGSLFESRGQDLYYSEFDDAATNNGVAVGGDDESYHNILTKVSYGGFHFQGGWISREKGIPTAPWGIMFNDRRNRSWDRQGYLELGYTHTFENGLDVQARLATDRYEYDGDYVFNYGTKDDPLPVVNKDEARAESWTAEFLLTRSFGEHHRISGGFAYRDNRSTDQRNFDEEVYLDDHQSSRDWGLYLQDEIRLGEHIIINAGLRRDHYESFGATTNPRLALILLPFDDTAIKLLYGTAFRRPSAYELYYHDGYLTQKPNPGLGPESITTWEFIVERKFCQQLLGTASAFSYRIDDIISQVTDPDDGLLVFRNVEAAEARGIELELNGRWDNGWRGRVSFTRQRTEDEETGLELSNAPRQLGTLGVSIPLLGQKYFAGFEVLHSSGRRTLAGDSSGSSLHANLTLFSRSLWRGLDLAAGLYNLFDEKYSDPGSVEHRQDLILQDGRTFRVQLTYRF